MRDRNPQSEPEIEAENPTDRTKPRETKNNDRQHTKLNKNT